MATMYILKKDVKLGQFRIGEGEFPDKIRSARQQSSELFEIDPILFVMFVKFTPQNYYPI